MIALVIVVLGFLAYFLGAVTAGPASANGFHERASNRSQVFENSRVAGLPTPPSSLLCGRLAMARTAVAARRSSSLKSDGPGCDPHRAPPTRAPVRLPQTGGWAGQPAARAVAATRARKIRRYHVRTVRAADAGGAWRRGRRAPAAELQDFVKHVESLATSREGRGHREGRTQRCNSARRGSGASSSDPPDQEAVRKVGPIRRQMVSGPGQLAETQMPTISPPRSGGGEAGHAPAAERVAAATQSDRRTDRDHEQMRPLHTAGMVYFRWSQPPKAKPRQE